jgi:hypothetical protein
MINWIPYSDSLQTLWQASALKWDVTDLHKGCTGMCEADILYIWLTVKLSLCLAKHHAMKTSWRSGGIAPRILNLDTRWRLEVSFTSRPLYSRRNGPRYPWDRRLGGPQSRSGRGGEEIKSHYGPCREFNPARQARSLVSILTELFRLPILDKIFFKMFCV